MTLIFFADDLINLGGAAGGDLNEKPLVDLGLEVVKHAYSHPIRQEADDELYQKQKNSSIVPTPQQLHEIYEENMRLSDSSTRNQVLEDERIALMLQNEEFMAELRRDTEFMSALDMEQVNH